MSDEIEKAREQIAQGEWIEREAAGRDTEAAAWAWLEKTYVKSETDDDPVDRAYGADEMVDAFHAGQAARLRALELPSTPKPQELAGER